MRSKYFWNLNYLLQLCYEILFTPLKFQKIGTNMCRDYILQIFCYNGKSKSDQPKHFGGALPPVKALINQEGPKRLLMLQKSVTLVLEGTHCTVISSSKTEKRQFKKNSSIFWASQQLFRLFLFCQGFRIDTIFICYKISTATSERI